MKPTSRKPHTCRFLINTIQEGDFRAQKGAAPLKVDEAADLDPAAWDISAPKKARLR